MVVVALQAQTKDECLATWCTGRAGHEGPHIEGECSSCGHAERHHADEMCQVTHRWCQCAGYWPVSRFLHESA